MSMSDAFKHCRYCTTKRHPGCHSTCEEYKQDLAEWHAKQDYLNSDKEVQAYTSAKVKKALSKQAKKDNKYRSRK